MMQLAHMADVEQAGAGARPVMLGDDALILDRHRIAGERHHAAAAGAVPAVEREGLLLRFRSSCRLPDASVATARARRIVPMPPLSPGPESFHRRRRGYGGLPLRWPAVARQADAFQSVLNARSFCLRDSGAVAPSAVARLARHPLPRVHGGGPPRRPPLWQAQPRRVNCAASSASRCSGAGPGQLEAEQHLEAGAVDRGADRRDRPSDRSPRRARRPGARG